MKNTHNCKNPRKTVPKHFWTTQHYNFIVVLLHTYSFLFPTTYLLACSPFKKSSLSYGLMAVNALKKPTNEGVNNKLFGSSIFEHEWSFHSFGAVWRTHQIPIWSHPKLTYILPNVCRTKEQHCVPYIHILDYVLWIDFSAAILNEAFRSPDYKNFF